ncbi:hypothetical protein [Agrococcus sp. ARC_14]|uniref:hypothetical protein n=1 Tax=Agrococcus sp. ARC_14 TaxID=2919927 RepID=UPI001F052B32|nr:hypothetical protein [Agrococcus sp. ARC_14]MCH1883269.1 hypothetical protein [Agrococcus sp. ARC_14]
MTKGEAMRRSGVLILGFVLAAALTGCATGGAGASVSAPPAPTVDEVGADATASEPNPVAPAAMPPADAAGQARADAWLQAVQLPPGAVREEGLPTGPTALVGSHSAWWCEPMGLATGYWAIPDTTVAEAANWLMLHPVDGLLVPVAVPIEESALIDATTIGNVPDLDALEGIAITVARADEGVVVRAEVGAFGDTTVCPTPPPGVAFGGPGQG